MANTLPGLYDYQGFDSGGNQIAAGEISIEIDQEQHVRGTWHLNSVGKNQSHLIEQIGPQFGNGILSGSLADRNLELDLHRTIDNSVVLHGKVGNGMITGHWEYLTDAGVSGTGTFKATRK